MPRSATDRAATSRTRKESMQTLFTVRMRLHGHAAFKDLPPAARSAAEAVSKVLREGVISHSFRGRFEPGKKSVIGM